MMTWDDVTLEKWGAYTVLSRQKAETPIDVLRITREKIMALTGLGAEEAKKIPLDDLKRDLKNLENNMPQTLHKRFELNGIKYKVITHLHRRPNGELEEWAADARTMTTGRVISGMHQQPERWHQAIFQVCRPVDKKGKEYEFETAEVKHRIEDFKKLPMSIAYPIALFFSLLSRKVYDHTHDSLNKALVQAKMELDKLGEDLQGSGAGGH